MSLVNTDTGEVVSLDACEAVIERGLTTFIEVGEALATIRDNDLYRQTHETFEDYCRERWGFQRHRAWRLIESSEIVGMLPMGNMPDNERQVRELAPLKANPGEMYAAWSQAKGQAERDERRVTAQDVREAVQDRVAAAGPTDRRDAAGVPVDGDDHRGRNASSPAGAEDSRENVPGPSVENRASDAELQEKVGQHLAENLPELAENQGYREASKALRSTWSAIKDIDPAAAGRGCANFPAGDLFMEKVDAIEAWLKDFRRAQNPLRVVKGER